MRKESMRGTLLFSCLLALALCSCGGGGGGGGSSTPPPAPSLSVAAHSVTKTAVSSDPSATLTLQAIVANTTSPPYIVPTYTQNAIQSVVAQSGSAGQW